MELPQKGFSMAEYIWIDGHGGVRSKTKVRISVTLQNRPYHPRTASMHTPCIILQPFTLRKIRLGVTEALLSDERTAR